MGEDGKKKEEAKLRPNSSADALIGSKVAVAKVA